MDLGIVGGIVGGVIGVIGGVIGTYFGITRTHGPIERAFVIKACVWVWVGVLLFLAAMFVVPSPYKYLLWIPYGILLPLGIVMFNRGQVKAHQRDRA